MVDLLTPDFVIGYTVLIAIIAGLFVFGKNEKIVTPIITVLTNILTGTVSSSSKAKKAKKNK